jgi:predicted metal-dependent phosphoesterase TrpH
MLKADFHLHTSADKFDNVVYNPEELIDRMAELGYKVIAITHHERLFYSKELDDYAKKQGIILIPGVEYNIEGKHVVVINTKVKERSTFDELRELKKKENIYVIAPHPYYPKRTSLLSKLKKNIDVFDAIEYAHLYLKGFNLFNKLAINVAKKHDLPMIGNSDCHRLSQLDNTYTLVDSEPDKEAIIKALKERKFEVKTRPLKFKTFLGMGIKSIKNILNKH